MNGSVDSIVYDMIENTTLDINQYNDFLRLMEDHKNKLYMEQLNPNSVQTISDEDFNDLPFFSVNLLSTSEDICVYKLFY